LPGLVALLAGAALAIVVPGTAPGDASPPATASFTAEDFSWHVTGDATSSSVTIAAGGTVTFGYPSGSSSHNADFSSGPAPASCTQTAGTPGGTPPPLPTSPTAAGWSGDCTFTAPGTYTFHCDLHPFMQGTIVVVAPSPPPTGTSTGTTAAPPTAPASTGPVPGIPPPSGAPPPRVHVNVAHRQTGTVVHGTVTVPGAGWRIAVTAFASSRALRVHRSPLVRVGSAHVRAARAGRTSFALRLDAVARRALRRRHRLGVRLRIVITPPAGPATVRTVRVLVRAPARSRQMSGW
jgi:plastocyanin